MLSIVLKMRVSLGFFNEKPRISGSHCESNGVQSKGEFLEGLRMRKGKRRRGLLRREEGFTLIEIIAVIIIMGILAAVAVPKFFSMQEDAKIAACNGALSEAMARFNHAYAKYILVEKRAPADVDGVLTTETYLGDTAAGAGTDIGDFVVKWEKVGLNLRIEIMVADTIGPGALQALKDSGTPDDNPTVKIVDGITWGS
jgi:MSHA pilin protein MshA